MMSFNTGLPDMTSVIFVEGYGLAQFRGTDEGPTVRIYLGGMRTMTIPAKTRWRYTRYK